MDHQEAERYCGCHIEYPVGDLMVQAANGSLVNIRATTHHQAAKDILAKVDPETTEYAKERRLVWDRCVEGRPQIFAALVDKIDNEQAIPGRIKIAINDTGHAVIADGLHRAAAAAASGVKYVPVEVVYRHERWIKLKNLLCAINGGPTLYQPVEHPDLASWPVWRKDTNARVAEIVGIVGGNKHASGIDIACHTGGLTRGLAKNYDMVGYDSDSRAIAAACMIQSTVIGGPSIDYFCTDEFEAMVHPVTFAVVFSLLNHHMVDGRSSEGQAAFRLIADAAYYVFLDAPVAGDPVGGDSKYTNPQEVFSWCAESGARGSPAALIESKELMRPILVWKGRS
jgi:hypothetical protein